MFHGCSCVCLLEPVLIVLEDDDSTLQVLVQSRYSVCAPMAHDTHVQVWSRNMTCAIFLRTQLLQPESRRLLLACIAGAAVGDVMYHISDTRTEGCRICRPKFDDWQICTHGRLYHVGTHGRLHHVGTHGRLCPNYTWAVRQTQPKVCTCIRLRRL